MYVIVINNRGLLSRGCRILIDCFKREMFFNCSIYFQQVKIYAILFWQFDFLSNEKIQVELRACILMH